MKYLILIGILAGIVIYVWGYVKLLNKLYPVIKPYLNKFYKGFLKVDEEIAQTKRFSVYEDNHRYNPGDPTNPATYKLVSFKIMACLIGIISLYGWFISRVFIAFWILYYLFWIIALLFKTSGNEKVNSIIFCGIIQLVLAIIIAIAFPVSVIGLL